MQGGMPAGCSIRSRTVTNQRVSGVTGEAGSGGTRLHLRLPVSARLHVNDALRLPEVTAFVGSLDVEQCTEREREQRYRW